MLDFPRIVVGEVSKSGSGRIMSCFSCCPQAEALSQLIEIPLGIVTQLRDRHVFELSGEMSVLVRLIDRGFASDVPCRGASDVPRGLRPIDRYADSGWASYPQA